MIEEKFIWSSTAEGEIGIQFSTIESLSTIEYHRNSEFLDTFPGKVNTVFNSNLQWHNM